jgi:archaellum component FlaC
MSVNGGKSVTDDRKTVDTTKERDRTAERQINYLRRERSQKQAELQSLRAEIGGLDQRIEILVRNYRPASQQEQNQ